MTTRTRRRAALFLAVPAALLIGLAGACGASPEDTAVSDGDGAAGDHEMAEPQEGAEDAPGGAAAPAEPDLAEEEGESAAREPAPGSEDTDESDAGTEAPAAGTDIDLDVPDEPERFVIHTARLVLESDDIEAAVGAAKTWIGSAGGYVQDESFTGADGEAPHAEVVMRVPVESYEDALEELAELGDRVELHQEAEDVTAEIADVDSRIDSAESSLERLRDFLDDADDMSEMLEIESDISERQADLEALQARQRSLSGQAGMSTISLVVTAPDSYVPEVEEDEEELLGFAGALGQGWTAFTTLVRWLSVMVGWLLPFLPVVVLAVLPLWLLRRKLGPQFWRPAAAPLGAAEPAAREERRPTSGASAPGGPPPR